MPENTSATCWIKAPASVGGAAKPTIGTGITEIGILYTAKSIRFCDVKSLHLRGGEGQHTNTALGILAKLSSSPVTASNMSFMSMAPSMVNAPV